MRAGRFFRPARHLGRSRGDIYVSEVDYTAGISRGLVGPDCHTLQKFIRRAEPGLIRNPTFQ